MQVFQKGSKENKKIFADYRTKIYNNHNICRLVYTNWASRANANIGGLAELRVACKPKEFVQYFLLERENPRYTAKVRYRYSCCKYSFMMKAN